MKKKVDIHGVLLDKVTMKEAVDHVIRFTRENSTHTLYTPNSEIVMQAQRDSSLMDILNSADLLVSDGAGIILASKILKKDLTDKVSGIDLVSNLFPIAKSNNLRFFFLGGAPGVAQLAAVNLLEKYKAIDIVGYNDGYFSKEENDKIVDMINASKANVLLVGLGAPKQEKWIEQNKSRLNVNVCIGIGGSFDIISGKTKHAPEIIRKAGFEWLYRLIKQPWRYKRMMDLPRFMLLTLKVRFFKPKPKTQRG